jgi:hypothetical protein
MTVEHGWSRLPRALRVAFVAYAGIELARVVLAVLDVREYSHPVIATGLDGLGFGALVLGIVGTFQASRRITGATVGLQMAVSGELGALVVHLLYVGARTVLFVHDPDPATIRWVYDVIGYLSCAFALVGAIGWAVAARDAALGVALGIVTVIAWQGYHVLEWLHVGEDGTPHLVDCMLAGSALVHTVVVAVVAALAGARNELFAPPRQPAEGIAHLAAGMWTGVGAIVMLGLVIVLTMHARTDHPIEIGLMLVTTIGLVGAMLFGLGATTACREPESAPPGWLVTASALLMFTAAGLAFEQLSVLARAFTGDQGMLVEESMYSVLGALGAGALGVVVALAGVASYMRGRNEAAAAQMLTTALIVVCVLMAFASVVLWSARDAHTDGGALTRIGVAGVAAIVAAALGARAFVRAASLFGTAPVIPEARLRR